MSTQLGQVFNVMEYGAVGDGVADDSTAIQACIDAAKVATPKGKLFFPSGEYLCNTGLVMDGTAARAAHWEGGGGHGISEGPLEGAALIAGSDGMTLLLITSPGSVTQQGPVIEYLNFVDESTAKDAILVDIFNVNRWTFRNCTFRDANATGGIGLKLRKDGGGGDNSWNMVSQCHFQLVDIGILTEGSNLTVVASNFNAVTWGIKVDEASADVHMFGGKFVTVGLLLEGEQCAIQGVSFEDCDPAIRINDTGTGLRGRRNNIIGCGITASASDIGIDLAGTDPSDNELIGNTFSGISGVNQISYGGSRNVIVGSNVLVREVDGADTLDWQTSVLNVTSYSGTRVITLPDVNLYEGYSFLIRREGTNTVTIDVAGSDVFDDSDTQKTLDSNSAAIGIFSIGDAQWKIVGTEGTVGGS